MPPEVAAISIGGRQVAEDVPPFAVAEIGLNHGRSLNEALALVDAASAGAHAVKLQTIVADALMSPFCPAPAHVSARSLVDFFGAFELDEDAHRAIARRRRPHLGSADSSRGRHRSAGRYVHRHLVTFSGPPTWSLCGPPRTLRPLSSTSSLGDA